MTAEKFSIEKNIKSVTFTDDYCDGGVALVEFDRNGVQATLTVELRGFYEDGTLNEFDVYVDGDDEEAEEAEEAVDFAGKGGNQEGVDLFFAHLSKLAAERYPEEVEDAKQGRGFYGPSAK